MKACWVRNFAEAPESLDVENMQEGTPPMLPREFCAYPEGQASLEPDRLRLVWFPEGDGIALMEDDEMLAAIPGWGGMNGFSGYARDCVGQSPLCWKLTDTTEFDRRIKQAEDYWCAWELEEENPWSICQSSFLAAYEKCLGEDYRYFAINGEAWPPRALVRYDTDEFTYLLTVGISLRPQPLVEMYYEDPSDYRRFEFAACFSREVSDETVMDFAGYLSGQSNFPWECFTFLGHGHTLPCDSLASDPKFALFDSVLLTEKTTGAPQFDIPRIDGERVALLWAVPITEAERELAEQENSDTLASRFRDQNQLHVIESRKPVV
jgi:hypothetical protein